MTELNEGNFQKSINTDDEWEEIVSSDGLLVVDVYQNWAGPCKAISKFLWRLRTQLKDKKLHFAVAKSDSIEALERYRGKCEPCFLIYGSGILVGAVRGSNPPSLEKIIKTKLEEEHLALKGLFTRIEIMDNYFVQLEQLQTEKELDKELEAGPEQVVLVIIKPDIVESEKHLDIISLIQDKDITILKEELRQIIEEEVEALYEDLQNTNFHSVLIKSMLASPAYFLILKKGGEQIINELRHLIGSSSMELAKIEDPESIRALFAKSPLDNAIHWGEDKETCQRELSIFYPDFVHTQIKLRIDRKENIQRTLVIIRPTAYREFKDAIIESIQENGFEILMQKEFKFTKEETTAFYGNDLLSLGDYLEDFMVEMSEGPALAISILKKDAINKWRALLGCKDLNHVQKYEPHRLRAKFSHSSIFVNLIHGSDSIEKAEKEIKYFFPIEQTIAAIKPDAFDNKDEILELMDEFGFKISFMKEVLLDKDMVSVMYKSLNRRPFFTDLVKYMTSGKCLFVILSKQNAIKEWRYFMGPTDPEMTEEDPDCLRALYGRDILENAIYGSSDKNEVETMMNLIFSDIELDDNGSVIKDEEDKENKNKQESDKLSHSKSAGSQSFDESYEIKIKDGAERLVSDVFEYSKNKIMDDPKSSNTED